MRAIGLDLSLTKTGYMVLDDQGVPLVAGTLGHDLKNATEEEKLQRQDDIATNIVGLVSYQLGRCSDLVVAIEGYAFDSKFNREVLAELHGTVRNQLYVQLNVVAPRIPPSSARKEIGLDICKANVRKKVDGRWVVEKRKVGTAKEQVREQLATKGIKFSDTGGDLMDAYVIAKAAWIRNRRA